MNALRFATILTLFALLAAPACADWIDGDPYKMHFPQLPDPNGWDIEISSFNNQHEVADDWRCSETGPVTDIHFWYSVASDGDTQIDHVVASIYKDDRTGDFSKPGVPVWGPVTFDSFAVVKDYGGGLQGFADPQQNIWTERDHQRYHQINIVDIDDPFVQTEGEIYWLGLYAYWDGGTQQPVGWKTADTNRYPDPFTGQHFEDDAVYRDDVDGNWLELVDPRTGQSLDMAFVITTPEPSSVVLMVVMIGMVGMVTVARRRR